MKLDSQPIGQTRGVLSTHKRKIHETKRKFDFGDLPGGCFVLFVRFVPVMCVTLSKGKYAQSGADRGKVDAIDICLQGGAIRTIATSWENTDR